MDGEEPLRQLREDTRPEVRLFAELAAVANFHNLDTHVVEFEAKTNRYGAVRVTFSTPTHIVDVAGGKVMKAASGMDSVTAHMDTNHIAMKSWYQCTGTWTKEAAIRETVGILERLGDQKKLEMIKNGKHEARAEELNVRDPNGQSVQVTPFYTVSLLDEKGDRVVGAQFRMGSNGPAGLVDWWNWP